MANYPTTVQLIGSREERAGGTVVQRAVSGKPRFRTYYSQTWSTWVVVHECDTSDKVAIENHYAAHKFVGFNFVWAGDGQTYTVKYADSPQVEPVPGTYRWRVETTLVGI